MTEFFSQNSSYTYVFDYTYTRCQTELQPWKCLFALPCAPETSRAELHPARWAGNSRGEDGGDTAAVEKENREGRLRCLWYHNARPARAYVARTNFFRVWCAAHDAVRGTLSSFSLSLSFSLTCSLGDSEILKERRSARRDGRCQRPRSALAIAEIRPFRHFDVPEAASHRVYRDSRELASSAGLPRRRSLASARERYQRAIKFPLSEVSR